MKICYFCLFSIRCYSSLSFVIIISHYKAEEKSWHNLKSNQSKDFTFKFFVQLKLRLHRTIIPTLAHQHCKTVQRPLDFCKIYVFMAN